MVGVKVGDETDSVRATWFNQPWVSGKLEKGSQILITGSAARKAWRSRNGSWSRQADEVERAGRGALRVLRPRRTRRPRIWPPKKIREWAEQAVRLAPNAIEGLPVAAAGEAPARPRSARAIQRRALPGARPRSSRRRAAGSASKSSSSTRRCWRPAKRSHRRARPAPRFGKPGPTVERWLASLPFAPTADQRAAFADIDKDLDSGEPMQRLLMGEVGSGKTVVAVYAMLRALEAGHQAALMAPTETLAEQHAITLGRLLAAEATPFALLTGATAAPVRRRALNQLASGELGLIVGTHALIEPTVRFARLGLCVVDEQHRFGVEQRRALDSKGVEGMAPHVLHMTATPIPRTLSLTAYGDLDTTALHELPAGRKPVTDARWSARRIARSPTSSSASGCARGARRSSSARWSRSPRNCPARRPGRRPSGCGAGRCATSASGSSTARCTRPRRRRRCAPSPRGETDVLVATTVIEVGIDVPNATVMMIEGAERFGVSQLHQLRGRVGRGEHPSQCLLFAGRSGGDGAAAAGGGRGDARRLPARRGRPRTARRGGDPRHPPERPARFAVASPARGRATPWSKPATRCCALLREHGSLEDPALGPLLEAARRRFGAGAADPIPL